LLQTLRLMSRFVGVTFVCALTIQSTPMERSCWLSAGTGFRTRLRWSCRSRSGSFRSSPIVSPDQGLPSASGSEYRRGEGEERLSFQAGDMLPTLTSALVVSLRAVPSLAMSLEHRGFGLPGKRTSYHVLETSWNFFTDLFISTMIPVALWFLFAVR
jgi:energy-coupling factor transport system permease protein